jgi:hypothetical protein
VLIVVAFKGCLAGSGGLGWRHADMATPERQFLQLPHKHTSVPGLFFDQAITACCSVLQRAVV